MRQKMKNIKWLVIPLSAWLLVACGNNNDEVTNKPENAPTEGTTNHNGTTDNGTTNHNGTTNNGTTNNNTNGEGATNNGTTNGNNTVTNANNNAFDFTHFSLDVDYANGQEFDVEYENEHSGVEASYEDDVNNNRYYGNDAYDRMESVFRTFKFNKDTSEDEVIKEVLNAFNLSEDYRQFDLEVRFADGTEKEYHKTK